MINVELGHVKNLVEFYDDIRRGQEGEHGDDYCGQHDAIKFYAKDCDSYRELGTHQGGTLANALLSGFDYVEGVDIDMHRYRKFCQPHAEHYARENGIQLVIKEVDSAGLGAVGRQVDMLLIDSIHKAYHMTKELDLHAPLARKYIVAHDTNSVPELQACLERFCQKNSEWSIIERGVVNVGFTVLQKNA